MSGDRVQMMKAARAALAEVGKDPALVGVRRVNGITRLTGADDPYAYKAGALAVLRFDGPDALVRCPTHALEDCDRVPVSWALLGHTCGRAS